MMSRRDWELSNILYRYALEEFGIDEDNYNNHFLNLLSEICDDVSEEMLSELEARVEQWEVDSSKEGDE